MRFEVEGGCVSTPNTWGGRDPVCVPEDRWRLAIADASAFVSEWGEQARAFARTERELFGLHRGPEQPAANYSRLARVDDMALPWLLRGRPVIVLTSTEAVMRCPSGATLTYRRRIEPVMKIAPTSTKVTAQ
jgi:hypothetical protein